MYDLDVRTTTHDDGSATVAIAGEVDLGTADRFRSAIAAALDAHPRVLLDLGAVTYLDSSGVLVLFEGRGLELVLDAGNLQQRLLTITGLDREMVVHVRQG